jgi:hypothetical protein
MHCSFAGGVDPFLPLLEELVVCKLSTCYMIGVEHFTSS